MEYQEEEMNRTCVIWLSMILIFNSVFVLIDDNNVTEGRVVVRDGGKVVTHDPIRINSNAEFDEAHGVVNWATGIGSQGNPWIIEGWDINGSGIGTCIYIGNTTDYFVIRDSHLHNANSTYVWPYHRNSGIHMYNSDNGNVLNNTLHSNDYCGMIQHYSNNTIITNNNYLSEENLSKCR